MRSMLCTALLLLALAVGAEEIELRPGPGGSVVITGTDGTEIHLQVLETGEILIPGMAQADESPDAVLLCYHPVSGELHNCPASIVDSPDQQAQIDALEDELQALREIVDELNPCASGRSVFVTSTTHTGNLGGLVGADQVCNDRADEAGLSGTYMAWLSGGIDSPATRFNQSTQPYCLADGVTMIANNWSDLTDGTLLHRIDLDENGAPASTGPWTGTQFDGTAVGPNCGGWTVDNTGTGRIGSAADTDGHWSNGGSNFICPSTMSIFCFEQ